MADLSDVQSAGITKLTGSDGSGVEQTPVQSTVGGALHANIRGASGNEAVVKNSDLLASDYALAVREMPRNKKDTYYATAAFTYATNGTDIFSLSGSATKTIRIKKISLEGLQTNDSFRVVSMVKRSTANSAGIAITPVPADSASPAATALVQYYTANPTLGTTVGTILNELVYVAKSNSVVADEITWLYQEGSDEELVLNGVEESICLNMNGVTSSGNIMYANVAWIEE